MFCEVDNQGNRLLVDNQGRVYLKLNKSSRNRRIGTFNNDTKTYQKPCKPENVFRKFNAFGFNHEIINLLHPSKIIVTMLGVKYTIDIDKFNRCSRFLNFACAGFELQSFVPVEDFTIEAEG